MPWQMYRVRNTPDGKQTVAPHFSPTATRDELLQKAEAKKESHFPKAGGVWYGFLERATPLTYEQLRNPSLSNRLEKFDP